jgi:hypothetical protein
MSPLYLMNPRPYRSNRRSHNLPFQQASFVVDSVDVFSLGQCAWRARPTLDLMVLVAQFAAGSAATSIGGTGLPTVTSRLWYRAVLCDAPIGARGVPMIREYFADAMGAAGWPDGACLFLSTPHTRGRRGRGDARAAAGAIFFSPAAIAAVPDLIVVCGAQPSPPPDRACATLLVGKPSHWDLLPRGQH